MEQYSQILFIDIETVPSVHEFNSLSEGMQAEWVKKSRNIKGVDIENLTPAEVFADRAGIFSEFGRVVCISFGSLHLQDNVWKMRLKSIANDDEKVLLNDFCNMLTRFAEHHPQFRFCGHNIKEFDIPYLCRRMVINRIQLPDCMQLSGKKPWEVTHLDTMELWKFGDNKNYTTLALLAQVLGIPSPKNDIDGSMVAGVYYNDKDLPRIAKYCMQDVYTTAKVFLRMKGVWDLEPEALFV